MSWPRSSLLCWLLQQEHLPGVEAVQPRSSRALPGGFCGQKGNSIGLGRGENPARRTTQQRGACCRGDAGVEQQLDRLPGPLTPQKGGGQTVAAPVGVVTSSSQAECPESSLSAQPDPNGAAVACCRQFSWPFAPRVDYLLFILFLNSLQCCVTREALERRAKLARLGEKWGILTNRSGLADFCHPQSQRPRSSRSSARSGWLVVSTASGRRAGHPLGATYLCAASRPLSAVNEPARSGLRTENSLSTLRRAFLAPFPARPLPPFRLGSGAGSGPALAEPPGRAGQCCPIARRNVCVCVRTRVCV